MSQDQPLSALPSADADASGRERRIRSFIRRQGRITLGQARALEALWPVYGLAPDRPLDMPPKPPIDMPLDSPP